MNRFSKTLFTDLEISGLTLWKPLFSPYSAWMRENTDQNNPEHGHVLHDEHYYNNELACSSSFFFFHVERVYFGIPTHPTTGYDLFLNPVITFRNFFVYEYVVCYIFTAQVQIARNFFCLGHSLLKQNWRWCVIYT